MGDSLFNDPPPPLPAATFPLAKKQYYIKLPIILRKTHQISYTLLGIFTFSILSPNLTYLTKIFLNSYFPVSKATAFAAPSVVVVSGQPHPHMEKSIVNQTEA